jgi:two-component system response regulator
VNIQNLVDMSRASGRLAKILLVEDDSGDARLFRKALDQSKLAISLSWVQDGEEALAYLRKQDPFAEAPAPDLVLLDLNMPKKSGYEVLVEMRADPKLSAVPVVILTTSLADEDVLKSYELRANAYVAKPVGLSGFMEVIKSIDGFWFSVVVLPATA